VQPQAAPININFSGLADLIRGPEASTPKPSTHQEPSPPLKDITNTSQSNYIPSKIPMDEFCKRYEINEDICDKLTAAKYTGPHGLLDISDRDLMDDTGLCRGQLADVRDGIKRWIRDEDRF
jgi:hypothetical protein